MKNYNKKKEQWSFHGSAVKIKDSGGRYCNIISQIIPFPLKDEMGAEALLILSYSMKNMSSQGEIDESNLSIQLQHCKYTKKKGGRLSDSAFWHPVSAHLELFLSQKNASSSEGNVQKLTECRKNQRRNTIDVDAYAPRKNSFLGRATNSFWMLLKVKTMSLFWPFSLIEHVLCQNRWVSRQNLSFDSAVVAKSKQ